ncbi:MAG: hypothetical protein WCT39_01455 [Candidatus Margulisiibacteriota bacterium]
MNKVTRFLSNIFGPPAAPTPRPTKPLAQVNVLPRDEALAVQGKALEGQLGLKHGQLDALDALNRTLLLGVTEKEDLDCLQAVIKKNRQCVQEIERRKKVLSCQKALSELQKLLGMELKDDIRQGVNKIIGQIEEMTNPDFFFDKNKVCERVLLIQRQLLILIDKVESKPPLLAMPIVVGLGTASTHLSGAVVF